MDIKINYTAFLFGDWRVVLEKHLFSAKLSKLYENCGSFNIFAYCPSPQFRENRELELQEILDKYEMMTEKTHLHFLDENQYEFPAIDDLIRNPADANMYFHMKGVSLRNYPDNYVPALAWNDYMSYYIVRRWDICTSLLKNNMFGAVGVEFTTPKNYPYYLYAGNFWWASRQHLEKLRTSKTYLDEFERHENRYACERVLTSVSGRYAELYNSGTCVADSGALYVFPIEHYEYDPANFKAHYVMYDGQNSTDTVWNIVPESNSV